MYKAIGKGKGKRASSGRENGSRELSHELRHELLRHEQSRERMKLVAVECIAALLEKWQCKIK